MEGKNQYGNQANSDHPATLIYLVDISGSMDTEMPEGKSRIEITKDAIHTAYSEMIRRSMRQGVVHPRYRLAMIGYTDKLYDIYADSGSIVTIDKVVDEGVPDLTAQNTTNMGLAFRYAGKLLEEDIKTWPQKWLDECPAPMVINLTDCELDEELEDPLQPAKDLMKISVPDGNVLVENIFITNYISLPSADPKNWGGYHLTDHTGDPYGDKVLAMSSAIPSIYAQVLREQTGAQVRDGSAMMFPGINREFIKSAFVMSIVSGAQKQQSLRTKTLEHKPS